MSASAGTYKIQEIPEDVDMVPPCEKAFLRSLRDVYSNLRNATTVEEAKVVLEPIQEQLLLIQDKIKVTMPIFYNSGIIYDTRTQKLLRSGAKDDFKVVSTPLDGDCLYSSFSLSLFGTDQYAPVIRLLQINAMVQDEHLMRPLCSSCTFKKGFEHYFKNTKTLPKVASEGWGDEFNLFLMSEIANRPVVVQEWNTDSDHIHNTFYNHNPLCEKKTPMFISLRQQHFQPLLPLRNEIRSFDASTADKAHRAIKYRFRNTCTYDPTLGDPSDLQVIRELKFGDIEVPARQQATLHQMLVKKKSLIPKLVVPTPPPLPPKGPATKASSSISLKESDTPGGFKASHASTEAVTTGTSQKDSFVLEADKMSTSGTDPDDDIQTKESMDKGSSGGASSAESANDNIHTLRKGLKEITSMMKHVILSQRGLPAVEIVESGGVKMESATSISQLLQIYPHLKLRLVEGEQIGDDYFTEVVCDICVNERDGRHTGVYQYHSSEGVDFTGSYQPRRFRDLKEHIKVHMNGMTHQRNLESYEGQKKEEIAYIAKNKTTGLLLGTYAYSAIKNHNCSLYEENVAIAATLKLPVGHLNHSRKFPRELNTSFYSCLRSNLQAYLKTPLPSTGRPPAFSLVADKYTPDRRCGQISGLIVFKDNHLVDINLDYTRVTEYTGPAIAEYLHKSLADLLDDTSIKSR